MSVPTSRASYRQHQYSGSRKSLKKVRAALRKHHAEGNCSRLKVWRSEGRKKPVKEIVIDNSIITQNTLPRTYARVKPKIQEATYSAPSSSTVKAEPVVEPLENNWPQVYPEIIIHSACEITSECESTSENDTIHVFCPKCKMKVPHTAAAIQQDQIKILIAKVYHYFEQEYGELKKMYGNLDLSPLSKIRQRTTLATGVSDSMLEQILEEERLREVELARKPRPHKRRRHEDSSSDENTLDDSDGDAEPDNDVQEPEQPYAADEPEIFVPAPLKTKPGDYGANNEQVQTDPISLDIKTEPQEDEMEIPIETQELNKPGTSKHKERKRTRKSQDTSTQNEFDDCKEEFNSQDEIPPLTVTLETGAEKVAIETGQVYACTCFMGCLNNRCICNKKNLLCNPKCHYNVDCMNK